MIRLRTAIPVLIVVLAPLVAAHAQPCSPLVECDDSNDCTVDACDTITSTCTYTPLADAETCSDGNACTPGDTCQAGTCVAGSPEPGCVPCSENDNCEDGSDCTVDTCDLGRCVREGEEGGPCDDENPCTLDDRCTDDVCAGVELVCDDGVPCTDDSCDDGACTSEADSELCGEPTECAARECRPDDPGADAQGCVATGQEFEQAECTEDQNPCTTDRCRSGACAHDPLPEPQGCLPVIPSYGRAVELAAGVGRLLEHVVNELDAGGDTGPALEEQLDGLRTELDNAARVLAGRPTESELPLSALRGLRLGRAQTTAQVRGRTALGWLRGSPARVKRFIGLVSGGRRRGELEPDAAAELRRNGRILLAATKALKRDVKRLQRTFTVFQR